MAISNQSTNDIDQEIDRAAMARMLNLRDILKLVNNRFNNRTLTRQQLVCQPHQLIPHVALGFSKEGDAKVLKQLLRQLFGDIASVSKYLTKALFEQLANGLAVIGIPRGQGEIEQLAIFVDDHMELEAKEPINRGFAPRRKLVKHTMPRNASIVAHLQAG